MFVLKNSLKLWFCLFLIVIFITIKLFIESEVKRYIVIYFLKIFFPTIYRFLQKHKNPCKTEKLNL